MKMVKYILLTVTAFTLIACQGDSGENEMMDELSTPGQTGTDISDDELGVFIDASLKVQEVQMQMQQTMMEMIESEEMDIEIFNQIATSRESGAPDENLDVDTEDLEKFDRVSEDIQEYGQEMESQLIDSIESEGMEFDRFQQINTAVQQDSSLQQRLMEQLGGMQAEEEE